MAERQIEIELCVPKEEDGSRIADIHVAAMYANPLLHAQFPTEASIGHLRTFLATHYATPPSSTQQRLVAREKTGPGRIIAFASWETPPKSLPRRSGNDGASDGENKKEKLEESIQLEGCCRHYLDLYTELANAARAKAVGSEECYVLEFVCTDPEFQRRGAGLALTRAVLDRARADGLPVCLESTSDAVTMYERLGFRQVGEFEMSIPRRGGQKGHEIYREVCMIWRPEEQSDRKN